MLNAHQNDVLYDCFEMRAKGWRYILHFHDGSGESSDGGTKTLNIIGMSFVELFNRFEGGLKVSRIGSMKVFCCFKSLL